MAMLATMPCLPRPLPRLPGAAVSRHGRMPMPGGIIGMPMPGGTIKVPTPGGAIKKGADTGHGRAQRISATARTVTTSTGTIDWRTTLAPRSSPPVGSAGVVPPALRLPTGPGSAPSQQGHNLLSAAQLLGRAGDGPDGSSCRRWPLWSAAAHSQTLRRSIVEIR